MEKPAKRTPDPGIYVEEIPNHPDRLTDPVDKYQQIKTNYEFTQLHLDELADVEIVGNGLKRAHDAGTLQDTEARGNEYTAKVPDSPADAAAAEQKANEDAAVAQAAQKFDAAPTGVPGQVSGAPKIPEGGISVEDLGGFMLDDEE